MICEPVVVFVKNDRSGTKGVLVTKRMAYLSGVSILSITVNLARLGDLVASAATRSIVNFTSSEVISLPSWNFTPLRSLNS